MPLGAAGKLRGVPDLEKLDPEDPYSVAEKFNAASCLIREIVYINDEDGPWGREETPEERYTRVRRWLVKNIAAHDPAGSEVQK